MASQRCKNKNLRPFAGTNLATLALQTFSKSREISNLYYAAHEEELIKCAEPFHRVKLIRRTRESAYGEDIPSVLDYVKDVKEETIAFINTSTPFLELETFDSALRYFKLNPHKSMMPAFPTHVWYFNADGNLMNADPAALLGNSKMLKPVYRSCSAFIIAKKQRILREHTYWSLVKDDPHIFEIPENQALDIDTEWDFQVAETLYLQRRSTSKLNAVPTS
jgi:CMP-N-acetylneuraminic acid synthetase